MHLKGHTSTLIEDDAVWQGQEELVTHLTRCFQENLLYYSFITGSTRFP